VKSKPSAPPPAPRLSIGLRRYLYLTAAVMGGVIMLIEILGAKMLSPYVGTSHFVWVAQIGVAMLALACGYYLGGRIADRSPQLGGLYKAHLVAAAWLCASVLACEPVAFWCLQFKLAFGTVLASLILYFVPLTLLAMTCPFLLRCVAESLAGVGGQMGRLTSVSTFGSFAGTTMIGYVLIPLLPNSTTMLLAAGLVVAMASGYFLGWARKPNPAASLVLAWLFVAFSAFATGRIQSAQLAGATELFRGNSHFGMLQVVEQHGTRYYLNDFLTQNTYDPERQQSTSMFTYMLAELARGYAARLDSALCIGMGVGIAPMDLARSGVKVDVVEINPGVVPLAERFFNFDSTKVNLTIGDGREVLNRATNRYDAILLDAFLGDSSPSHLMTREAFAAMQRRLVPGGVLVINSFGEMDPRNDFFTASLNLTLKAVFKQVRIHASGNGNVFFVAGDAAELTLLREPNIEPMHPAVQSGVRNAFDRTLTPTPGHGIVLTDDFNPVEYHDAANREEMRKNLAFAMRRR
jgi:spermidine synthase